MERWWYFEVWGFQIYLEWRGGKPIFDSLRTGSDLTIWIGKLMMVVSKEKKHEQHENNQEFNELG